MATKYEPLFKYLTASGAVTADGKAGVLHYVKVSGDTAGDTVAIKNGATTVMTLIVPAANGSVEYNPPIEFKPIFTTDIDVTITTSNNVYATFIYTEIQV